MYRNLGTEKQFLRRKKAGWASRRDKRPAKVEKISFFWRRLFLTALWKMGEPRISTSSVSVMRTPPRRESIEVHAVAKASGTRLTFITSDLDGFTSRPSWANWGIMRRRSAATASTGPPMVPSSRYQTLRGEETDLIISSIARAKSRGPRGSPCWTPVEESFYKKL